jgi:hypothetical protein
MSSDSGSDSGSSSSSYSGYDEAGISTPTTAYESIGTTGYDEAGTTTPSYSFDSIGTTGYDPSYTYQPTTEQLGSPVYTIQELMMKLHCSTIYNYRTNRSWSCRYLR